MRLAANLRWSLRGLNHVDFGMSLPAALAAPWVSQTNSPTSLAEPPTSATARSPNS